MQMVIVTVHQRQAGLAGAVQLHSPATGWVCSNRVCWISWCFASPATGWTCMQELCLNASPATGWACRNSVCWISWCCASPATGWTYKKMVSRITGCFRHNHQRHAGLSWIHINERGAVHAYYLYLKIYWCRNANINNLKSFSFFETTEWLLQ